MQIWVSAGDHARNWTNCKPSSHFNGDGLLLDRSQPCQLSALDDLHAVRSREHARLRGDLARRDVDQVVGLVARRLELLQRLRTGVLRLHASADDERGAAVLAQLEVERRALRAAHLVALALPACLERGSDALARQ